MRATPTLAACIALLLPLAAAANDSTAVLEAGGLRLVRDAPVEIVEETLFISADLITVDYTFRAADNLGTTTIVAFPLPEYDLAWLGSSVLGMDGDTVQSRSDFRLWIDGREHQPEIELKALRNGIDVTGYLSAYNIPVASLDYSQVSGSLSALPAHVRDWLAGVDLVRWNGTGEPDPLWTLKATYYWTQTFPPGRDVRIRHEYRPVAGRFFVSDPELRDFDPAQFCMTSGEKQGVRNRIAGSRYRAVPASEIRYILSTGAHWSGPIARFTLIVDKGTPEAMVSLCFDGLIKTSPTRFEATRHDFEPSQELEVLFLDRSPE